ncbi:hypothetical protein DMC30DRAFT_116023 [Rhodotorula diobovata]|uniref:GDSL lipase/esterase n=1 Tax=Rhodotorula diobovata TaxID=5288 RepID=A0A5C5G4C8_9BASI|nr:hypothetical protein DMC30DRAFT_116023 [Rhodotorula diobovata]
MQGCLQEHARSAGFLILLLALAGRASAFLALEDTRHWFAFGDSWSATGYDESRGYKTSLQPLKTSSGGRTWLEHLSSSPACTNLYDTQHSLAVGGATVWSGARAATLPNVSLSDQVDRFEQWFVTGTKPTRPRWRPSSTVFSIFLGTNDVAFRWWTGESIAPHVQVTFPIFDAQIERLYKLGARNFVLFTIPPYERAPVVVAVNRIVGDVRPKLGASVAAWNAVLRLYALEIPRRYPGTSAKLFDTWAWFDELLDRADEYGFLNSRGWCPLYARGLYSPVVPEQLNLDECGVPLEQYLWYDGVHPTWAVHRLLAASVRQQLSRKTSESQLALPSQAELEANFPIVQGSEEEKEETAKEYRRTVLAKEDGAPQPAPAGHSDPATLFPVLG